MTDKTPLGRQALEQGAEEQATISEDITRIVRCLSNRRSFTNERAKGLMQDMMQLREGICGPLAAGSGEALAGRQLGELVRSLPERELGGSEYNASPALAERYHAFCHEFDLILEGFRARVEGDKPVLH